QRLTRRVSVRAQCQDLLERVRGLIVLSQPEVSKAQPGSDRHGIRQPASTVFINFQSFPEVFKAKKQQPRIRAKAFVVWLLFESFEPFFSCNLILMQGQFQLSAQVVIVVGLALRCLRADAVQDVERFRRTALPITREGQVEPGVVRARTQFKSALEDARRGGELSSFPKSRSGL